MTTSTPTPVSAARTAERDQHGVGAALAPRPRFVAAALAVLLAGAGLAALPTSAALAAGTITVATTADGDANNACASPTVTTVAQPVTLRNALCVAGNQSGTTTVTVPSGTYTLQAARGELAFGSVAGAKVTVVGAGAILPGQSSGTEIVGDGQHRVMNIDPQLVGGVDVTLRALTVRGGVDDRAQPGTGGSGGFGGAGIIAGSAGGPADALTLDTVYVMNNTAKPQSGGGWNSGGAGVQFIGGSLTLTDTKILNNQSAAGSGGGVYYEASPGVSGQKLTITGGTFSNNQVTDATSYPGDGGGLSISGSAPSSTITGTGFVGNGITATGSGAVRGGAIAYTGGIHTLTGAVVKGNTAATGSQISADAAAQLTARYSDIGTANPAIPVVSATGASTVDAAHNWWGCATAPGSSGCAPSVSAGVTVLPSLRLSLGASPSTVGAPGDTSTLTASFRRDSAGAAVAASDLTAFAGQTDFSTTGGRLSAPTNVMTQGSTSTTLTTPAQAGQVTVTATYSGVSTTAVVTAPQAPAFTSGSAATFTAGTAGSFTITTTGYPAAAITRTAGAVPAGLTFTDNGDGTATLAGTPTASGTATLTLKAANGSASPATQQLSVTVRKAAAITSAATTTFRTGTAGSFTVTASGSPTPTLTESGALPSGVTFTDNGDGTATLAGTPTAGAGGQYQLSITASNGVGANAVQPFTLTVNAPPTIDGGATATATAATGSAFSRTITTTAGYPTATTIAESGILPSGVTFTDNGDGTATLAGTPAALSGGVYSLQVSAGNGIGTAATQQLTLTVTQAPAVTSNPVSQSTTVGSQVAFSASGTGYPTPSIQWQKSVDGGLTFADLADETSGTLSLTATADLDGARFRAVFTNATGSATTAAASLAVGTGPAITSAATATISGDGATQTITITASGKPTPSLTLASGSVPGLDFVDEGDGTATLSGVPTASGEFTLNLVASNSHGEGTQTLVVTVQKSTAITSSNHATFTAGTAGTFTVTTEGGYPTPPTLELEGDLPSGVGFVDNGDGTATLSGAAAAGTGGSYAVDLVATTAVGHVTRQPFTLTVTETSTVTAPDRVDAIAGVPFGATVTTSTGFPTAVTLTTGTLPAGVDFVDNGDGTGTLSGTVADAVSAVITITATNGAGSTSSDVTLVVAEPAVVPLPLILPALSGPLTGVPAHLEQGQSFTVSGTGFAPHAPITLGLFSTPTTLATVESDEAGAFTATLTVPADFALGDHTVVAAGVGADGLTRYLGAPTTVSAADVDPGDGGNGGTDPGDGGTGNGGTGTGGSGSTGSGSAATGSNSGLAATGVGEGWMLAAALALLALLAGIRLVIARRRAA